MIRHVFLAGAAALALAVPAHAQSADAARILDEGMNRSQAMPMASELMDGIGARLTNSPSLRRAEDWATSKFSAIGLSNVHKEAFDFGRGWDFTTATARMVTPRAKWMRVIPVAWTPGTGGQVLRAPVIVAAISKPEHMAAWRGKLGGKIVLLSLPGTSDESKDAPFQRLDDKEISGEDQYRAPSYDPDAADRRLKRRGFAKQLDAFLKAEGAVAWVRKSYRDNSLLHGEGYLYAVGDTPALPGFEMSAEDYRQLTRLAKSVPPSLELMSDARFDDTTMNANNIFADIPGSDPKAGYVMAGAHFDSWVAGDGASDNGAGSIVVMEAARILRKLGVRPKRTIRFALWEGEEQGLLGSRAYLERHMVDRPVDPSLKGTEATGAWSTAWPLRPKPGYSEMKAYFNMDNGSGRFRGLYAEQNAAAVPILKSWLAPLSMLDADRVVIGKTSGTDHVFMQAIGLQGYQFIQDPLDYESRVHHSNLDTLDHMRADDIRQAAVVMATVLLNAANSDKELPRPPLPQKPVDTDPFDYLDPDK